MAVLLNVGQYAFSKNLGTKATEYCLHGVPVFLNKTKFKEEIVKKYNFGVCVNPENIDEYSATLRRYIDNINLLEQLGSNGRKMIEEKYNWDNELTKLKSLYSSIHK
jgi:glycosyltransferase involved in cell wall biosynthesis